MLLKVLFSRFLFQSVCHLKVTEFCVLILIDNHFHGFSDSVFRYFTETFFFLYSYKMLFYTFFIIKSLCELVIWETISP